MVDLSVKFVSIVAQIKTISVNILLLNILLTSFTSVFCVVRVSSRTRVTMTTSGPTTAPAPCVPSVASVLLVTHIYITTWSIVIATLLPRELKVAGHRIQIHSFISWCVSLPSNIPFLLGWQKCCQFSCVCKLEMSISTVMDLIISDWSANLTTGQCPTPVRILLGLQNLVYMPRWLEIVNIDHANSSYLSKTCENKRAIEFLLVNIFLGQWIFSKYVFGPVHFQFCVSGPLHFQFSHGPKGL